MKDIYKWHGDSQYIRPLSPACSMCSQGSKMVVLVTGLCNANCFYCPLSFEKGGKDRIFADEWELKNETDTEKLILEAKYIDATGAGITGGDPLVVYNRTKKYISLLKENFGSNFHIHLYTSGLKNSDKIPNLINAGLDEIRFHPMYNSWNDMNRNLLSDTIKNIIDNSVDVAIEIPAIPKMEKEIISLIKWADNKNLSWVNLNELEFSERNADIFIKKGYQNKNDVSAAVLGSQETAVNVLNQIKKEDINIGVHYCSVSFKDGVQLRNRIVRRAKNIVKRYEVITDDGTLVKGAIYNPNISLKKIFIFLKNEYQIPDKFIYVDKKKNRIEIGLWILEEIAGDLIKKGYTCFMVEEYPTADRLEVERIPLPF